MPKSTHEMLESPDFKRLVRGKWTIAIVLTIVLFIVYYGYILLIAFDKEWLATKLGAGYVTSIGIPMGVGVIIFTVIITTIYVRRANTEFDSEAAQVLKEAGK